MATVFAAPNLRTHLVCQCNVFSTSPACSTNETDEPEEKAAPNSPGDEAAALALAARLGGGREEQLGSVQHVDEHGQLGLHERLQLVLQQRHDVLRSQRKTRSHHTYGFDQ